MPLSFPVLNRFSEAVLNLFFPPVCAGCDRALGEQSVLVPFLCEDCFGHLPRPRAPLCVCCAEPLPDLAGEEDQDPLEDDTTTRQCARCREERPVFDYAVCPWRNAELLEQMVHQFKYAKNGRRLDLARPLGALMERALEDSRLRAEPRVAGIVPVPLHPARLRERGFNQAAVLGEALGRAAGWPVVPALRRVVNTESQTHFTRDERRKNLRNAFEIDPALHARVKGQTVIVLDDILTTGSTLHTCAKVLRKAGCRKVIAVALARTAGHKA